MVKSRNKWAFAARLVLGGSGRVKLINGSMRHAERQEAINHFEEQRRFLISTEAGGEGINLQSKCHIMVNYNLPMEPHVPRTAHWPPVPLWIKEGSRVQHPAS